jgi:hypothetical protein
MKNIKINLFILCNIIFLNGYSQKFEKNLFLELGGTSILYTAGFNGNWKLKDSSKIGLSIGIGYFPIFETKFAGTLSTNAQLLYNPNPFINGKFTFRAGTSFYFNDSYTIGSFYDPSSGLSGYTYSPASTYTSFNVGCIYNVLKPKSRLKFEMGIDAIIALRDIKENHIEIPVIPFPVFRLSYKLK